MSDNVAPCAFCSSSTSNPPTVSGYVYCSKECQRKNRSRMSSERMARTNRKHCSARMKTNNPMHRGDNLDRMRETLRAIGHRPKLQGGNGRGVTRPQRLLADALGWATEVVIPTGRPVGSGFPSSYKVDIGSPSLRIAVEVDGSSHGCRIRREQDRKKEDLLRALGWRVLRFKNAEVLADVRACAETVLALVAVAS